MSSSELAAAWRRGQRFGLLLAAGLEKRGPGGPSLGLTMGLAGTHTKYPPPHLPEALWTQRNPPPTQELGGARPQTFRVCSRLLLDTLVVMTLFRSAVSVRSGGPAEVSCRVVAWLQASQAAACWGVPGTSFRKEAASARCPASANEPPRAASLTTLSDLPACSEPLQGRSGPNRTLRASLIGFHGTG